MSGECEKCGEHAIVCKCRSRFTKKKRSENKKIGSAPLVFLDEEKRKEWEKLDSSMKNSIFSMLHECAEKMQTNLFLEMICNILVDMDKRIRDLENKG